MFIDIKVLHLPTDAQ